MCARWRFRPMDHQQVRQIQSDLDCSHLLAQCLVSRGLSNTESVKEFLATRLGDLHDPGLLPGIEPAVERLLKAIEDKEPILIYGDYDVDGVTATSILWHCLKLSNANVDYFIPCRFEDGYGLNCDVIKRYAEEEQKPLIVTVDCGITSLQEAELAKQLGIDLIITDHHNMKEELPDAFSLIHPRLPGSEYPFGELCGAGVAFKLAWALCQKLGDGKKASPRMREFLISAMTLAMIGTISDVVPLVGENRILVKHGLKGLENQSSIGLKQLMSVAGLDRKGPFVSDDIGFALGPRINAAGRLGQARLAVELLTTDSEERARQLAEYLNELNKQRQSVERKILKQAKELVEQHLEWLEQPALVLAHEEWHGGVIGIVANRVAEHFQRPTILITMETKNKVGQGSGRRFGEVNLYNALQECQDLLIRCGGHAAAVGLQVSADRIDAFREKFCQAVGSQQPEEIPEVDLTIDAEVTFQQLTLKAIRELDLIGPFGAENRKPVFASTEIQLAEPPKRIGGGERHLSVKFKQYNRVIRAVAFGKGDWAEGLEAAEGPIQISYSPNINRFRGYESVEIQLIDWQAEVPQEASA